MYCSLLKTQAFPLVIQASADKTLKISHFFRPINLSLEFSSLGVLKSGFSSFSGNVVENDGKMLPWLAKIKERKMKNKVEKENNVKKVRSSWEESAEKFLNVGVSDSAKNKSFENLGIRDRFSSSSRNAVEHDGDKRPWLAKNKERRKGENEPSLKNVRASWEEKRDRFRDNEGVLNVEEVGIEGNDDVRWDKIKERGNKIVDSRRRVDTPDFQRWNKVDNWGKKTWKEATESSVPNLSGEGVYGVGPVLAALTAGRRELYALYVQEGIDLSSNNRKKKDKKGFEKVLKMAEKMGLRRKDISKHDLNMVADNRPHQGLILDASPLEMVGMKELDPMSLGGETENQKAPLWVALDEVTDPQNLGAIIRSAYFFGAEGVVLCAKNSAPLSGVVSKASAGSLEFMELRYCKNMMQFLVNSSENGWRIIGGSVASKAVSINEIEPNLPTILVLGSEGTGLRPLVERSCTDLVRIPGNIPCVNEGINDMDNGDFRSFLAVESLNVSVAAGVLLHHLIGRSLSDDQKIVIGNDLSEVELKV